MRSYKAVKLFTEQLQRNVRNGDNYKTKVVMTPTSIEEKGVIIKVSVLKTTPDQNYQANRHQRTVKLRVQVAGAIESHEGLRQAVNAIEALDQYLLTPGIRLEEMIEGEIHQIPNTRIQQDISPEDSFIDAPDSLTVQDVADDRYVFITIPED